MKVLDATFLIDYLDGVEATREFYEANGGEDERWVMPVVAYAEALVGEGNLPDGDIAGHGLTSRGVRSTRPTNEQR